jgi:hypothetical protein
MDESYPDIGGDFAQNDSFFPRWSELALGTFQKNNALRQYRIEDGPQDYKERSGKQKFDQG